MTDKLRHSGLRYTSAAPAITGMIAANGKCYGGVRIRCVAFHDRELWRNALCMVAAFPANSMPAREKNLIYENARLLEVWVDLADVPSLLGNIVTRECLELVGEPVYFKHPGPPDLTNYNWEFELSPGHSMYASQPGHIYRLQGTANLPNDEVLLASTLPFYSNISAAIQDWCGVKWHGNNDARAGNLVIFLPECRAHIETIERSNDRVTILVQVGDGYVQELRVKGGYETTNGFQSFDVPISDKPLVVDLPSNALTFEAYLIGPDETLYDFHKETQLWSMGQRRILSTAQGMSSEEQVVRTALSAGEGMQVECKPYIKPGDSNKLNELIETTIAFANTSGGSILVGIDNHCNIVGIQREIAKTSREDGGKSLEEAYNNYVGQVKQTLGPNIHPSIRLDFTLAKVDGHTVLLVRVPEGDHKPYHDSRNNAIYIRRGANNVFPHPEFELPQLFREHRWPPL